MYTIMPGTREPVRIEKEWYEQNKGGHDDVD
jgi:hypothetical protein